MKKKFTNIVVFLAVLLGVVIGMPVWSQNLVVNPSFENTSSCPVGISEFSKALNWSSVNSGADTCSSPDLYAGCAPAIGGANSPNALIGFQNSRTGSHHAGIILYEGVALFGCNPLFSSQYREYIEGQVSSPLVAGQKYCVKFYVSLANCKWGSDDIGIYFTNTLAQYNFCNNDAPLPVTPQLNWCSAAVLETEDWVELRWTYTANGGENYFVIGNFKNDNNTSIEDNNCSSIHSYAYYFIDDVSITPGCCPVDMAFTNIVQPTCGSNNGSINLGVANSPICGENGSVSYLWSNGATTKNVANLAANTYTVTVTNQGGCTATLSTVLNNGGCCPTVVTINTTAATCGANNGSISAVVSNNPVAPSYLWLNNATTASVSNVPPGTYTVTVTTGAGCVVTASGTVVSSTAPTPPVIPPQNVCNIASTTLNAGNGYSGYAWSASNGGTISSATNAQGVIVTSSGTYTVVVTAANGCTASTQTTVVINTLTASASANSPCIGGVLTLSATGPAGATYSWAGSNGASSSQQNPSINNVTAANSGTYTVTVTGTNGCTASAQTTVSIGTSITPTFNPIPAFCSGTAAPTLPSTSNNGIAGTWSPTTISNATSGIYNFTPNAGQCASAASLTVTVNPSVTPTFTPIPAFCSGTAAPTLPNTSNNGIAGTWLPTVVSNTISGTYSFTPNAGQCATTASLSVTVNPSVTPTFTPIPAFCSGTTAPSLPSTSNNGVTGTWLPTVVSNTTSGTYAFTPNAGQCASATSLSVTVNPSVTPTFTPIPAFCSGTAAPTLPNTSNNGVAGTWLPATISNTTSGTYNFTPNAGQCASAASLNVTVNPSVTPTFTPIPAFCSGMAAPTLPSTSNNGIVGTWLPTVVSNTTSGTYNFTPNAGQCASATSLSVTVNPSITPTFTPILAFCSGTAASTLPSTSNNGIAGTWSPATVSNTTSGTYSFTPNAGQCASTASLSVTVNALPNLNVQTSCGAGLGTGSIVTTANALAGGALSYAINGVADADGNETNLNNGTYTVLITENPSACTAAQTVSVNCNCLSIVVNGALSICQNTAATYTQTGGNAGGQWAVSPSGAGAVDANGNFVPSGGFSGAASISYAANGCTGNLSININPLTTPTFNPIPAFCSGTAAPSLPNTSNNGIAGTWSPATISNTTSGTYNFTPNAGQCASAASLSVTVDALPNLSVQTSCGAGLGTGNIATTANASAGGALSYTINGVADADGNQTSLNNGTYTVLITENPSTCTAAQTVSVNCNCPTITIAGALSICQNTAATYTQTGGNAGGQWSVSPSGAGAVDANGNFVPSGGFSGAASISYAANGCTGNLSININPLNPPTFTPIPAFCSGTTAPSLPSTSNNGIVGTWLPTVVSNTTSGTYNFTPNAGQCASAVAVTTTVNPSVTPIFTPIPAFCSGTAAPSLPSTSNNGIAGTWSPTVVSNTTSGTYNFTPNAGQCASAAAVTTTVNPSVTPTFTPIPAFCSGTAAPSLPSTSNNGIAGTWSPTTISNATSGTYNFTPNAGQCASAAAITTTVNALPNLSVQTSCGAGLGTGSIATTANASAGGTLSYAINGVADADGNQTNLTNGTYTVLITENPSTCTTAQTVSVNCNCPTITIAGAASICQNTAATYTQTGGNAGGQWSVSPSGAGAVDANGNFVPSGGFSGAASISYAANGCTGNLSININPLTTPTFTPIPAFCSGTTAPSLPNTSNNGIAGTWSPTVVSNTTSGTYNFTPNAGQCASEAAVTTTVNPSVTPTFTPIPAFCSGTAAPSLPSTSNNGIAGTWSPTTISNATSGIYNFTPNAGQCASVASLSVTINALPNLNVQTSCGAGLGTGTITTTANASVSGALSYTINGVADADGNQTNLNNGTYTVLITENPSTCTTAQTVSVNCNCPTISIAGAASICQNAAATYTQTGGNAGGQWSVSPSGAGTVDANGNFVPSGGFSGAASISYAANGCTGNLSININPLTTPTFTPIPAFCSGTAAPTLPNTSNNGIAGTWSPTVVSNTASGTYNFTPNAGQCASAAAVTTTVNPSVTPTFTPIPAFCSGTVAPTLPNTSNNGIAGTWSPTVVSNTTSGTYAFTPNAGQCASAASLSVTVNALPNLSVQTSCGAGLGTGSITTAANASAGGALSYAINGVADADGNQTNLNNGTYTVLITENPSTCTAAQTVSVNCNCPSIVVNGALSICQNAAATYTQTGGNAGGQWSVSPSGAGAVDANGNFVPSGGFSGAASISYAANGCTGNLSININPLTTPTFTPIPAFCSGTAAPSLPSTSNNGIAGTWSPTVVSNTTSGTYNFTPNAGQCASAAAVTTTVNPSVTPTFTPIPAFCSGTAAPSLPSTSNNGIAGTWSPTTISNATSGIYNFTPNAGQCASVASLSVAVNALPNLSVTTSCGAGLGTGSVATTANASAGGVLSYAINGVADADGNETSLNNGTYTVLITENPSACTAAQTVSVNCNCPSIVVNGALSICQNTAATYTQTGGNAGGQWSVSPSGAGAVDANGNFVPSGGFSGAASISYAANGCTGNLSININPLTTPTFNPIPAFCSGTVAPSLPSTSNNGIAGTWLPTTISNTTSGTYAFTPNAGQCASVASLSVTVNALPNLNVQTSCGAGLGTGSIATTANASAGGALSYAINGVADADGNQTNLNNGTYTVLITENPSACTAAQTVSVNCNCPSIVVNGALSICQNGAATYTQTGGNAGGQWSVSPSGAGAVDANGNFVPSGGFSGAASISYAANGCTGNLSISINPLNTPTFTPIPAFCSGTVAPSLLNTSNNGIVGTWLPATVSNTASGTYTFTPNAGQCSSNATLSVTVNALPSISVVAGCGINPSNGSGILTITASVPDGSALEYAIDGVNFQASNVFSNLNNGAYIVTVRAISTSCIATASTNISCACIAPTLTVSSPNPICQNATGNATISLSNNLVNTTGTPPNYYSTLALANAGGMGDVVNPDAVGAGTYFVRSNNAADSTCFSIEPITVVINNLPTASIGGIQNYCVGDAANALTANGGISYVWNNGTMGNTLIPSTNNATNTTYTVTVTDANTCQNTAEITVNVSEVSVILSGNTLIELGDSTTLHATAITLPNSTLSYTWLPTGLCQDADCSSITVSPNINGIYSVTVSNEWGCLATDNISLQVTTQNTLVIPNAFSPNGDNVNEVFHIGGTNIAQFELLIYDRWGQKTFETQSVDLADGWDGKYPNGIDAELAVYVYYLNVTFTDGKTQFAKGNVTLVR